MWVSTLEINNLLGIHAADALAAYLGGTEVYVPVKPRSRHILAEVIGEEAMAALCAEYGGIAIKLPNPDREPRKEKVQALLLKGLTRKEIARRCGVTERYVYQLASLERDSSGRDGAVPRPAASSSCTGGRCAVFSSSQRTR